MHGGSGNEPFFCLWLFGGGGKTHTVLECLVGAQVFAHMCKGN